ncbi:MAG: MOSC N-terminal beta barrel domain-containing protein [Capsulimonadaceae bacterium]|nr:MOSC N-terminal beta barrel domain-containing protein [Capsulimonadaceae bacterium]
MAFVNTILVYPIKSLEPVYAGQATLAPGGGLAGDRTIAIVDEAGAYVNGKRHAAVHGLRASVDFAAGTVSLARRGGESARVFAFPREQAAIEEWLSGYFGFAVHLVSDEDNGYPDDRQSTGPTVLAEATLGEVARWFPGLSVPDLILRFRPNIIISGTEAFWDDRLYGASGEVVRFRIGDAVIEGTNPCQRCVVPPRDPHTAESWPDFSTTFRARREDTLPPWANRERFNHFYRLAVNTRTPADQVGKTIRVGDEVTIIE